MRLFGKTLKLSRSIGMADVFEAFTNGDSIRAHQLVESSPRLLNERDNFGMTSLHMASMLGSIDFAEFLINRGADVSARTHHGWTPLHYAAAAGKQDIAALLLDHFADINAAATDGGTVLDAAAINDQEAIINFLMTRGAVYS